MSEPKTITVEHAPVFDLDLEKIGAALRIIPASATRVGHGTIEGHLWYGVASTPEEQFVRDMFSLSMPEMAEKWYGGASNAGRFAAKVWATVEIPRRKP